MVDEHEAALIRRTLDGDREAFGELVAAYQRVLYNVALRMVCEPEDAKDLVQSTFLKAYRRLDTYDPQFRFFSWIYRILRNETLNLLRRRRPATQLDETIAAPDPGPEEAYRARQVTEQVRSALMQLSVEHREVLVLRHLLHESHRDIGLALGIPERTVKSRLYTARQALGALLRRRGAGAP